MGRESPKRPRRRWIPALRPRAGRRLPRELRPENVGRIAEALPEGVADPGFEALLSRIDESVFHPGNRVDVFFRGEGAFASMLAAVAAARSEVLLETYILKDDETGKRFQKELIAAAGRGVTVRVLADAFGSLETRSGFWRELETAGIETRLYHGLGVPMRFLKFRDHRKILVADRRVAFTGGMNIGDEYGSASFPAGRAFRDTHARVEGPAAREMAAVFEEGWKHAGGAPIGPAPPHTGESDGTRVMVLDSRPGRGAEEVAAALAATVAACRRRLRVTMAYFAPRSRALAALAGAARRGVDVRLVLPGRSDVALVRHTGHGFVEGLLEHGVRVFEYQAAVLHAKTLVADGLMSVVGSSNLDFRSFERNAECNVAILDTAVGARMEAQFSEDLTRSAEIRLSEWRRRPWPHRLGDAFARRLAPLL